MSKNLLFNKEESRPADDTADENPLQPYTSGKTQGCNQSKAKLRSRENDICRAK